MAWSSSILMNDWMFLIGLYFLKPRIQNEDGVDDNYKRKLKTRRYAQLDIRIR